MTAFQAMQNRGLAKGQLVVSKAGHDTGRVYLIVDVMEHFVSCVDGDLRGLDKPKRKRWRHVKPLGELEPGWDDRLAALKDLGQKNALVRKLIADHSGWISKMNAS
ncbi:MAG: KOW domain-containing RNA-binding protein [Eubacteriales bacterium]|nr:KOW domain-containing RNA-binding protein [Eubacteriales bacterium]